MARKRTMTPRIRVLVLGLPELLRAIIARGLSSDPNMTVSESTEDVSRLVAAAKRHRADVIVTSAIPEGEAGRDRHAAILEHNPRVRIFCFAPDGRNSWKQELVFATTALGEISPDDLAALIRGSAGHPLAAVVASRGQLMS